MVDRYLSPKFGVNPLDGFRENDVYAGQMDDDGSYSISEDRMDNTEIHKPLPANGAMLSEEGREAHFRVEKLTAGSTSNRNASQSA